MHAVAWAGVLASTPRSSKSFRNNATQVAQHDVQHVSLPACPTTPGTAARPRHASACSPTRQRRHHGHDAAFGRRLVHHCSLHAWRRVAQVPGWLPSVQQPGALEAETARRAKLNEVSSGQPVSARPFDLTREGQHAKPGPHTRQHLWKVLLAKLRCSKPGRLHSAPRPVRFIVHRTDAILLG